MGFVTGFCLNFKADCYKVLGVGRSIILLFTAFLVGVQNTFINEEKLS